MVRVRQHDEDGWEDKDLNYSVSTGAGQIPEYLPILVFLAIQIGHGYQWTSLVS